MKRLLPVLLLLLASACFEPNGKKHKLYFGLEFANGAANGLSQDVLLPDSKSLGNFNADFSGTTLQADGPGLTIIANEQMASGAYRLRVLCSPDSSEPTRELHAQVMADGAARYDDAYDLACLRTSAVNYSMVRPTQQMPVAVGAEPQLQANFTAVDKAGKPVAGFGHGFAIEDADPSLLLIAEDATGAGMQLSMHAQHPGDGPRISAGVVDAPAAVQVLDDSQWHLEVTADRTDAFPRDAGPDAGALSTRIHATAIGRDADGGPVYVDACQMVALGPADAGALTNDIAETCDVTWVFDGGATGQVCAVAQRHQECLGF